MEITVSDIVTIQLPFKEAENLRDELSFTCCGGDVIDELELALEAHMPEDPYEVQVICSLTDQICEHEYIKNFKEEWCEKCT
ncbi:MAG: hypothetical protein PHV53_10940, partial [Fermentimonas sp.]|nr:hypothetical protein [Fermentimonas sp.]